jgi:hypothetical protein
MEGTVAYRTALQGKTVWGAIEDWAYCGIKRSATQPSEVR